MALPAAVGANFTVNELVAPGFSVPAVKPLIEKPVPEALAAVTETAAVPVFLSVTVVDVLLPTTTLPKLTLDGFADSAPCAPVPLSAIVAGEPGALLVIEMLPEALPAEVGANVTVNVVLAPALIDIGARVIV